MRSCTLLKVRSKKWADFKLNTSARSDFVEVDSKLEKEHLGSFRQL